MSSRSSRSSGARCQFVGAGSPRCRAPVSLVNAIRFPRGGRLPKYCAFHQQVALSSKSFSILRRNGTARTMTFKRPRCSNRSSCTFFDYILGFVSRTLEPCTQLALRYAMVQPLLPSDGAGYIYALELAGRCCSKIFPVVCACRPFPPRRLQARPHSNQGRAVHRRSLAFLTASQPMPIVQTQAARAIPGFHCTATSGG